MTHLLYPALRKAELARVVNVRVRRIPMEKSTLKIPAIQRIIMASNQWTIQAGEYLFHV
jgi:hypothetical protein